MKTRLYPRALLCGFLAIFSGASFAWGQQLGQIGMLQTQKAPSALDATIDTAGTSVIIFPQLTCHDMDTGRPLSCAFSHEIISVKSPADCTPPVLSTDPCVVNNGGHLHTDLNPAPGSDPRPLFFPKDSGKLQLIIGTLDAQDTRAKIFGHTAASEGFALIQHPLPQAAEVMIGQTSIFAPPGYICGSDPCFTLFEKRWMQIIDVGFLPRFVELTASPDPTTDPFTLTGGTDIHPFNHFGTSSTVRKLRTVAQEYVKRKPIGSGIKLSINDMSLPGGGVFDLCGSFFTTPAPVSCSVRAPKGGHVTHRLGTAADIDQQGIPCLSDYDLLQAVTAVGGTRDCESGGRKHVFLP